jgi:hypothetical protein
MCTPSLLSKTCFLNPEGHYPQAEYSVQIQPICWLRSISWVINPC